MKKFGEHKAVIIFLATMGVLALPLLSVALRDLQFRPPVPFSFDFFGFFAEPNPRQATTIPFWRYFIFGGVLLLVLAVIMFILDPELRKRVLQSLVRIGLILGLIWLLMTNATNRAAFQELIRNSLIGGKAGNAAVQGAAPVIAPPEISPWVVFVVSFGIGLALILVGWSLYTHRRKPRAGLVMDEVASIARKALDELGTGHDWDDAIVGAYIRMNEVVNKERGLFRLPGNTPSEFGRRMERIGLPGEAVRTLTSLFEAVRYGGKSSSREDRDLAAAALSAILHSCGRNA